MNELVRVVYWDASAVLSLLFVDCHSETAAAWWRQKQTAHLLSTLAYVETGAVIARLQRTGVLTAAQAETAREVLSFPVWRQTTGQPARSLVEPLASRWPLRGADLWHLACVGTLRQQLPELQLLTFDSRLAEAAAGEGFAAAL